MGAERLQRLEASADVDADVDAEVIAAVLELVGKQTRVDAVGANANRAPAQPGRHVRTAIALAPERLGFEDYRVLGLRALLQRLGPAHALRPEVLAAADRVIAQRATRGAPRPAAAPTEPGRAMWRAAERHAVTLYRHAFDAGDVDEHSPAVAEALDQRGGGQPLPAELRAALEAELRISLASVRVHTDAVAAQAALAVRAEAFTVGDDIFFADGAYAPDTAAGRTLLVHELAHVAQARRGAAEPARGRPRTSRPDDALEREADAIAATAAAPAAPSPSARDRDQLRATLRRAGVELADEPLARLAEHYRDAGPLTEWALGGDPRAAVERLLAHAAHGHRQPLDPRTRAMIEHATGRRVPDVEVALDPVLGARGRHAEARAGAIHLAASVPGPDDAFGLRVRLHEVAHVAQMDAPDGTPAGDEAAIEHDAEAVAAAAARGERRPVGVAAGRGGAYGLPGWVDKAVDWGTDKAGDVLGALDPMQWLRSAFPQVARLLDEGFDGMLEQLGRHLWGALRPILDGLGLDKLLDAFSSVSQALEPGSLTFGVLTGCCSCLEEALDTVLRKLEAVLNGEGGRALQQRIANAHAAEKDGLLDMLADFFGLLQRFGGPVMEVIGAVESAVGKARAVAGKLGELVWGKIADVLGLDRSLGPLAAIKAKLQQLWAKAAGVLGPIAGAIKAIGAILAIPFAPVIAVFTAIPKVISVGKQLLAIKAKNAKEWLAAAAKILSTEVFQPLMAALGAVGDALEVAAAFVAGIVRSLADKLGQLAAVQGAVAFIRAIIDGVVAFAQKLVGAVQTIGAAVERALTAAAKAMKQLYDAIKPLLDFVSGLVIALVATAAGQIWALPLFVLGNLFLHVLPDCYKVAVLDFILKAFIALVEWFPANGMPVYTVVRSAALGFLRRLLAASVAQKVKAMNLVASLFAGNVEFAAGLVVGVLKGLYESTIGTVVFVFEAAAWLGSLGLEAAKLAGMSLADLLAGDGAPQPDAKEPDEDDDTEEEVGASLGDDEDGAPAPAEDDDATAGDEEGADEGPDEEPAGGTGGDAAAANEPSGIEPPPAIPPMASGRALFEAVFRKGVTRQELEALLHTMNTGLDQAATKAGAAAATAVINALTSDAAAYQIGETVGTVIGMVIVEAAIIFFTGGAGAAKTAVTLTKLGIKSMKGLRGAIGALQSVMKVVKPILQAFQKLKGALASWAQAVARYIDDLIQWAQRTLKKLLARPKPKSPHPHGHPDGRPPRPRRPRPKDRSNLRLAAMRGAQRGWAHVSSSLGDRIERKGAVRARLSAVRVTVARGIVVDLSLVSMGSSWKVKARARKGVKAKTWRSGAGWITTKHRTLETFYAAKSHKRLHADIVDDAIRELQRESDQPDEIDNEYEAKKRDAKRIEQEGQRRIRLEGVDFTIELEPYREVEDDLTLEAEFLISPNALLRRAKLTLGSEADLKKAKAVFKRRLWPNSELADVLGKTTNASHKRIQQWSAARKVFKWQSGPRDSATEYTFDRRKAGQRPMSDTESNREKYGYVNPSHGSPEGITILRMGLRADSPSAPPLPDSTYDSVVAGGKQNFPHNEGGVAGGKTLVHLGHKPPGAVGHWNREGHTQEKQQNLAWNRDPSNYQGPEYYKESSATGRGSGRYEVPRKSIGSHPSWWQ